MTLPLYSILKNSPPKRSSDGHAGLWFDKFCNEWLRDGDSWSMSTRDGRNPKMDWINTLTANPVGADPQITEFATRTVEIIERRGGEWAVFKTESRFVTGLGRSHPVENGFAWHPTLGAPYIPGSSVKGMVKAWAEQDGADRETREKLFGERGQAGGVCFLDAIPLDPVQLEADVMTPHYAGWDKDDPPGDWRSPTPIPFLVSAAGTAFLFGVIPVRGAGRDDAKQALRWLGEALEWAGAGAKTAVGYGRFAPDEAAADSLRNQIEKANRRRAERARAEAEARERETKLVSLSPVEREIQDALDSRADKGMAETTAIFNAIRDERWSGDTKVEAAQWLKAQMEAERNWKPTTGARRPQRDRPHQRTLQVISWLEGA